MMLIAGRMNILYCITKETLGLVSVKQVQTPFLIALVLINLINLYIVLTRSKYQKVYTKEELKELKEKEVKLSDLRHVDPEEEKRMKQQRKKVRIITLAGFAIFFAVYFAVPSFNLELIQHSQHYHNSIQMQLSILTWLGTMGCSCISYSYGTSISRCTYPSILNYII